jgi:hypothetical protein
MIRIARPLAALALAASVLPVHAQQVLLSVDTRANRIVTLNPQDGSILNGLFITDANNPATYDFQTPRAAIQVDNEIWVSDQSTNINAIHRFTLNGGFVGTIGGAAGGLNNVRGLRYIDGTVYVANAGSGNGAPGPSIVRISPSGTILSSFSTVAAPGGVTVGNSPWDVNWYDGKFLVTDGTSRGLLQYNADGSFAGALIGGLNNIPAQVQVRANGNLLLAANGSTPTGSFGLYELTVSGGTASVLRQWTGSPGLGVRGVYELGNGRYLIAEAGGASSVRGLGTIDPTSPVLDNNNFTLIEGLYNGGWISAAVIPEPGTWALMLGGSALLALRLRRERQARG